MASCQLDRSRLIHGARRMDAAARDELLESYRQYLRLLARTWTNRALQVKADPSDLVQETLLNAHRHFHEFRGTTEPELATWLRQVLARNVVDLVRRYRGASRQLTREQSLEEVFGESSQRLGNLVAASGTSPSQSSQRRDAGVVLAEALADLSADHREVIVLRSIEEADWNDVARQMNRSVGAVRMLWARALTQLRPAIEARL